ncbi:hypothetical protein ABVK25_003531 [Lepraria finkii]|uniref:Uncharacterized protein n=1 Tax=Lepraria finkii TaxID=1340010 RepID=A0ABR4BDG0_9LECA
MSRPVKITQQDTEYVSGVDLKDATEVISNIVKNFENIYRNTKADFEEVITKKGLKLADSQHWHSRTIAVVADADTGIIVTGATKPVAPGIPIFEDVADNISRIRVGEDFGSIIVDCSKDVWNLCNRIKPKLSKVRLTGLNSALVTEESAELYDAVVNAKKDSIAKYQNIPSSENGIMSWAFGSDFKFKRPCTHCQRLYSGWVLHEIPDTPDKKLAGLRQD